MLKGCEDITNLFFIFHNQFCYRMDLIKLKWALPVVILCLLKEVETWNKFCSVVCTNQKCSSAAYAACEQCANPWTMNAANVCQVLPTSGWAIVDISETEGGTLTGSTSTTGTCGPQSGGSQWTYTYIGNQTGNAVVTFSDTAGTALPHYQLRIVVWFILIDNWQGSDNLKVTLEGNQTKTQTRNSRQSNEKTCGNGGDSEDYVRFDQTYTHNSSSPYDITITTNNSNSKWGIREVIVLAKLCHPACLTCWSALVSNCWTCQQDTPMLLSGTTCNQSCLPGYGNTSDAMVCVLCDIKCTVCYEYSYNCSACKNTAYLWPANFSCVTSCPTGMYANTTDRTCYDCNDSCISCRNNANYCFECDKLSGFAWMNYVCYNPCPTSTFLSNNDTNCTACSVLCQVCAVTSTNCSVCTLNGTNMAYLYNTTNCVVRCPNQTYPDTAGGTVNTCQPCDYSCYLCTADPYPCQQCNPNFWLYNTICGTTCPDNYFQDNVTWTCLLCDDWCVLATMDMYFPDSTNSMIYVDMKFTEDLDFTTFPYTTFQTFEIVSDLYTLSMFHFTYTIINARTYRITIEPKGYIFLYNATIKCRTMDLPNIKHKAQNQRPFKDVDYGIQNQLIWFVIKAPDMTDGQKAIINGLSGMSNAIRDITTQPYIQEIKKSGAFMFLFAGAQITSCSVLVNNIPSQNLYEGVRFWAIFVFFDVPPWQKNSDKTKYVVVPPVSEVVKDSRLLEQQQRMLFDTTSIQWRFARTGHSSFFIFDTYPVIALILFCWILLALGYCLNKHKPLLFRKHMGKFFTFVHKVHEIAIMYIMLATIMEWLYFNGSTIERWLSLGFCILVNVYFLIYELYIYYDMIKYPVALIGNQKYEYYAIRYGSYLKHIRYEEYDLKESWSPKQWFRPYNYHILAYYKKLMMIVSLPLFYHTTHAQAGVLILLQAAQIVRFCVIWPYYKKWRNIYRLILECALQMFFISVMIQGFLVQEIMLNNEQTLMNAIQLFYRFGWVGFGMVFFFNVGFIVLYIYDLIMGCRKSNRKMMDEARRIYYYDKLKAYEEENEDVPLGLVNKWVKLGNLNDRNYDALPDVNIRVEYFRIAKLPNGSFEVQLKKLTSLYMNIEFNFSKDNNVNSGHKINKRFTLTRDLSKNFYYLLDDLYRKYDNYNLEYMTIKTFQRVEQSLYKPGEKVEFMRDKMTQRIILELHTGEKKTQNLDQVLNGFPIPAEDLSVLP